MLRKSLMLAPFQIAILPWDRKRCLLATCTVILQCILVFVGSGSILACMWSPNDSSGDYNKLARIMYLYDYQACKYKLQTASSLSNIQFPNETYGMDVKPIAWKPAIGTVSTRLSSKSRRYIEISIAVHVFWMLIALVLNIVMRNSKNLRIVKFSLAVFFYASIAVFVFDISMAVVYIAHIRQSLTKSMILRYSGWSVELKLKGYDDFAGWLPIAAAIMWLRGIFILILNIYICKFINNLRKKIKKKEVKKKLMRDGYLPIPEPNEGPYDTSILYFRTGENKPYIKDKYRNNFTNLL